MKLQNIRILIKYYVGDISQHRDFLLIYLSGVLLSLFPVGWSGTGVTFFGFPLELYGNQGYFILNSFFNNFSP